VREDAFTEWPSTRGHELLRAYSDTVNRGLLERWLPVTGGQVLKTDAFDEAVGDGLVPLLRSRAAELTVIDVSEAALEAARERYPGLVARLGDVRRLDFADETFDVVVSNSTLDHLGSLTELRLAMHELARVLRPGGTLILTLDNPANPLVRLRNLLPYGLLRRVGVVQYRMGVTCGPRQLRQLVGAAGLDVADSASLMHVPRLIALCVAAVLPRGPLLRGLHAGEALAGLPTRHLTAQFIGVRAVKR
jgi:SAM-dependent methyltransferase